MRKVQNFLPRNVATLSTCIMHPCQLWRYEDTAGKPGREYNIFDNK